MKQLLHILHIEDSAEDSELIQHMLKREGLECTMERVETRPQVFDALQQRTFDIILADFKLPSFSGMHALEIAHALRPEVPFIFVSGTIGEETAIESLRNGATDYVLKDRLSRLPPAVRRSLAEAEERTLCRQLQQRLREAGRLEAVSTLSNGIAHDFNNILTIILGHTSLLAMEYDRPERVLEITETISHAARRASDVVQQLLAFARKSDGHVVPTDLNRRVQETLSLLKGTLPPKVEFAFNPARELPSISADNAQLERILINLVTNAVDSMPNGGHISITTETVAASAVPNLLPELGSERYVHLRISDEGGGMDESTRQHIFEPFYTTKERGRGTGLGLPVVYGLMQAHRGVISVDSEEGKGTVISLYFPVLRQPEGGAKKPPASRIDPALSGQETILVIEDEADVSFFLETIFQSHGYRVLVAHEHDQAMNLFNTHEEEIRLVFSDIGLPKVDGITICAKLKALKPELKVILSSGYSPKEFKERMDEMGMAAFVPKPYNTQDVLRCVKRVLAGQTELAPA